MAFSFGSYSRRRRGFLFDNVVKKLKLNDQEVATIDSGTGNVAVSGASGGGSFSSDSSAPSSPSNGDLWYDTAGDVIYAYVNDGTTDYWIDISGEGYYGTTGNTATYTGNVSGGNLSTGGIVSATGNITGGNLTTAGAVTTATVSATGNISGGNISATGNVSGGTLTGGALTDGTASLATGALSGATTGTFSGSVTASAVVTPVLSYSGTTGINISSAGIVTKPNHPAFRVTSNSGTNAQTGTIPWDTVDYDRNSDFDTTNNRFVAPVDGIYYFSHNNLAGNNGNLNNDLAYYVNGTIVLGTRIRQDEDSSNWNSYQLTAVLQLSASDYVDIRTLVGQVYNSSATWTAWQGFLVA
jgi:hypothetical protein